MTLCTSHTYLLPHPCTTQHRYQKGNWVVYEQPACKLQTESTCGTWKSEFIIFIFKGQILNNRILSSPSFTNLTPAVFVLPQEILTVLIEPEKMEPLSELTFCSLCPFSFSTVWEAGDSHFSFFKTLTFL